MKTLAWSKLPASRVARQRNIWTTPTHSSDVTGLDFDEMERLFTVTTAATSSAATSNSSSSSSNATERKKTADEV